MFIASLPSENQKKHQEFSLLSAVYPIYNWMWYMIIKDKQTRKRQFLSKWRRQKYKNEKKVSKWSFTQSTFALGTTAFFIKLIHSGLSKKNFTNSSTVKRCMQLLLKKTLTSTNCFTYYQTIISSFVYFPFSCDITYARVLLGAEHLLMKK